MKTSFFLSFFLLFGCAKTFPPGIDGMVKKEMEDHHIPGLALGIVQSGEVVYLKTYGYSDLETGSEATTETPFHIASVSKTVVNVGIFKLVETGQIDLLADINNYLPFRVDNPYSPSEAITVRQLLNHRSGIRDDLKLLGPIWGTTEGDSPIQLENFLKNYLSPEGEMYHPDHYANGPGRHGYEYSNMNFALLGLMIEHVSKTSLESFFRAEVFGPLGMSNTSWFLKNLDMEKVAKTYSYNILTGHSFNGHNGYPDYPAGQLRTSIADFSRFIQGFLNANEGGFVLRPATANTIAPDPRTAHGGFYTWMLRAADGGLYYAHGGGDIGASSLVLMDVRNRNAVIIFINGESELMDLGVRVAVEVF